MSKLASIKRVDAVYPIEGADKIEVAQVGGWKVIVKKDEFKVGDLGVYFEIDSFLPEIPQFEFLRKSSFKHMDVDGVPTPGFRIKTMKLRGQLSQGLLLPIYDFEVLRHDSGGCGDPDCCGDYEVIWSSEGDDVTEELGVRKYEKPVAPQMRGHIEGYRPHFIPKTDQERVQNLLKEVFGEDQRYQNTTYEVSIKLEGSSITVYGITDKETGIRKVGVCSRNLELKLDDEHNVYVKIARESGLLDLLSEPGCADLAFQGELVGPGVQGNYEKFPHNMMFVFDVFDIENQIYVPPMTRRTIMGHIKHALNEEYIKDIPVIEESKSLKDFSSLEELLEYTDGPSVNVPVREGLVFKANGGTLMNNGVQGSPFSFKVVNNKFLLEHEE